MTLPNESQRQRLFQSELQGINHLCSGADFEQIARKSDGFTGDMISTLIGNLVRRSAARILHASHFKPIEFGGEQRWEPSSSGNTSTAKVQWDKTIPAALTAMALLECVDQSGGEAKALKKAEMRYDEWTKAPFVETE